MRWWGSLCSQNPTRVNNFLTRPRDSTRCTSSVNTRKDRKLVAIYRQATCPSHKSIELSKYIKKKFIMKIQIVALPSLFLATAHAHAHEPKPKARGLRGSGSFTFPKGSSWTFDCTPGIKCCVTVTGSFENEDHE